jgi:hypothetical protein
MISERQCVDEIMKTDDWWQALARVTTVGELMRLYNKKNYSDVTYYISTGDFVATKSGGTWLISLDSVVALWGKPKKIA